MARGTASVIFFLVAGSMLVTAFHTGAPDQACSTMVPQHGPQPQTDKSPYRILLASTEAKSGEPFTITLTAPTIGPPFKGFFIQVRAKGGNEAVGTFEPNSDPLAQPVSCGGKPNTAMTHKDNNPKVQVTLKWIPPQGDGEYEPMVTFVKQQDTFWVKESPDGKTVKVSGGGGANAEGGNSSTGGSSNEQEPKSNNSNTPDQEGAASTNLPVFVFVTFLASIVLVYFR